MLALAFPNLQLTAIDSTGKKVAFVERAAKELGLRNLQAVHGRSCELNCRREFRRRFDVVTARAVAAAPIIYLDACDFAKRKTGRFILYKTPQQAAEDLPALEIVCRKLPVEWRATDVFELPEGAGQRLFLYSVPVTS
ncbi:Ribosomal RNA small subunit methyltransferase G [bioreactor metagenome]|uniref:Ribosomal RNA small subunit methyltransferase G n=1 Tax=bioreactor metagenome TaxID=1076179 RepID=A0A645J6I1_9ZZZZ